MYTTYKKHIFPDNYCNTLLIIETFRYLASLSHTVMDFGFIAETGFRYITLAMFCVALSLKKYNTTIVYKILHI